MNEYMRVAAFDRPQIPFRIETRPIPVPGPSEVLVRVRRCGVCTSDLHWTEPHARTVSRGTVLGHEFSGEVVGLGGDVAGLSVGERVCAMPFTGCGACEQCAAGEPYWCAKKRSTWGGYGEYTLVAASGCVRLPGSLSWADGALVEPLSSGLHAVRLAELSSDARVLVIGAGPIGLSCIYWLRRAGAASIVVVARTMRRRELALAMGATEFLTSADVPQALDPDVVFECAGSLGTVATAMQMVRPRGKVVVAGMCTQPDEWRGALGIIKQLRLQFVGAYGLHEFRATVDALASGDGSPRQMVTSTVSLDELPAAFEALRAGSDQCKILVNPWAGAD